MKTVIHLNPVRSDRAKQLTLDVQGPILVVNGEEFDFSPLVPGDLLPAEAIDNDLFVGPVVRTEEGFVYTLTFHLGPNAPEEARFPAPITIVEDGPVAVPDFTGPDENAELDIPPIPEFAEVYEYAQD